MCNKNTILLKNALEFVLPVEKWWSLQNDNVIAFLAVKSLKEWKLRRKWNVFCQI